MANGGECSWGTLTLESLLSLIEWPLLFIFSTLLMRWRWTSLGETPPSSSSSLLLLGGGLGSRHSRREGVVFLHSLRVDELFTSPSDLLGCASLHCGGWMLEVLHWTRSAAGWLGWRTYTAGAVRVFSNARIHSQCFHVSFYVKLSMLWQKLEIMDRETATIDGSRRRGSFWVTTDMETTDCGFWHYWNTLTAIPAV